jgi:hypothetical protein
MGRISPQIQKFAFSLPAVFQKFMTASVMAGLLA